MLVALQKLLLRIKISELLSSVSSIFGIPVLGRPPSWCTPKFIAYFDISQHCAHQRPSGKFHRHRLRETGVGSEHTT
jgi:hypothetical protein